MLLTNIDRIAGRWRWYRWMRGGLWNWSFYAGGYVRVSDKVAREITARAFGDFVGPFCEGCWDSGESEGNSGESEGNSGESEGNSGESEGNSGESEGNFLVH